MGLITLAIIVIGCVAILYSKAHISRERAVVNALKDFDGNAFRISFNNNKAVVYIENKSKEFVVFLNKFQDKWIVKSHKNIFEVKK